MESAEQLWRAGEYEHYIPVSPTESDTEPDNEPTLVPSHDTSFEDTLTEDNVQTKMKVILEDEHTEEACGSNEEACGFNAAEDVDKYGNDKVRDGTDIVSTDGSRISQEGLDTARIRGAEDGNEDVNLDGDEDAEQSFLSIESIEKVDILTEGDEVFEDCVGDEKDETNFNRIAENYSLEMKLALGIDNAK